MGVSQGEDNTTDYRLFLQQDGKDVSSWHDIPLHNEDGTLNFVCEIPKETSAKMEVATVSRRACFFSTPHEQDCAPIRRSHNAI